MKFPTTALCLVALAPVVALAQDAPIDWKVLATEFSKDSSTAEAKYQGKVLTVTGPISAVGTGDTDKPCVEITISSNDGPGPDVKCQFDPSDLEPNIELFVEDGGSEVLRRRRDEAGKLLESKPFAEVGQQITVKGTFADFDAGDIVIGHARKVKKDAAE